MNYLQSISVPLWAIVLVGLAFLYLIVRGMPRIEGYVVFGGNTRTNTEAFEEKKSAGSECLEGTECMSGECQKEEGAVSGKCM